MASALIANALVANALVANALAPNALAPSVRPAPLVLEGGGVRASLSEGRAGLEVDGEPGAMRAVSLGRGAHRVALGAGRPVRVGDAVHTERAPGVIEWWQPAPRSSPGLEHGVHLAKRPIGEGALTLELALEGFVPEARTDDAVALLDALGTPRATYAHLVVLDAEQRELPAALGVRAGRITITIDDDHARYPVVVDPLLTLVLEATLPATLDTPPDAAELGSAVAIDADGTRVIVGAPRDVVGTVRTGSARIFVRSGTTWTEEATLTGPAGSAGDRFGQSVAISGDGSIVVVGAPRAGLTFQAGVAYTYLRTGTSWALDATLRPPSATSSGHFGESVALSSDGRHALVGEPGFSTTGRAFPFERVVTTWTRRSALILPSTTSHEAGMSVALTSDGSRALVGAPSTNTTSGRAASFTRVDATWTFEGELPVAGGTRPSFGAWVACSGDGSTAAAGGAGRTDVYVRAGATWTAAQQVGIAPLSLSSDGAVIAGSTAAGLTSVWSKSGATWNLEGSYTGAALGTVVGLAADGTRVAAGAPTRGVGTTANAGAADVLFIDPGDDLGAPCTSALTCLSGICTDGVCCNVGCGNGAVDCQACSAALTGGASGTCAPLSPTVAPTVTCRAAGPELCAAADVCEPTSTRCPADGSAPAGTQCRAPTDDCDLPELCTGSSNNCPAPGGPAPAGTMCRPPAGACDVAELCDGASVICPAADVRVPAGLVCRAAVGDCDVSEQCDGVSPVCPDDVLRSAGTVCLAAMGECDAPDLCDGVSGVCAPRYQLATVGCGEPVSGVCDVPDFCSGTSADCVRDFLADVECRPSNGGCDPAELCTGDRADCPPDQTSPMGMVCRVSSGLCDPAEVCDGVANTCPPDVTRCADDAAQPEDGGAADASTQPPPPAVGCACRASRAGAPPFLLTLVVGLFLCLRRGARPRS